LNMLERVGQIDIGLEPDGDNMFTEIPCLCVLIPTIFRSQAFWRENIDETLTPIKLSQDSLPPVLTGV
jgi:hypothetical protein